MSSRAPRLLLINPNTTPAMTRLMLGVAHEAASGKARLTAITGRFGARYIASRAAAAIAGHAALDALEDIVARHGRPDPARIGTLHSIRVVIREVHTYLQGEADQ